MSDTKSWWNDRGFADLGGFTPTPHFLTKDLMAVGTGIPPLFWKFTSIAWRSFNEMEKNADSASTRKFVCTRKFSFTAQQLADEYGIYEKMANWCSAAYSVSGFCFRETGRRYNFKLPGTPTTLHYHKNAMKHDWLAFVAALKVQCRQDHRDHFGGCDEGFRVSLAWKVIEQRNQLGLAMLNKLNEWLAKMKQEGIITTGSDGTDGVQRQPAKKILQALEA